MPSFVSYDGTKLSYAGVGAGPPLLCIPGGPGRAAAYLEDLAGLSGERTLVLLDGRATGRSEVPADPSTLRFDRLADDVEALRAHLGLETVDVLGHSAGSVVTQCWAAAHPERVRSLVLVTPSGGLQGSNRTDVAEIVATRADEPWYDDAAEALAGLATASRSEQQMLWRAIRPLMYGRWDERTQAHAATAETQSSKRAELGYDAAGSEVDVAGIVAGLRAVEAPVLVVAGDRDAMTGVAAAHAVASCFPRSQTVVLPRAGHFPWVDEPAAFAEAVRGFLADV